jgi:hypothetical protein
MMRGSEWRLTYEVTLERAEEIILMHRVLDTVEHPDSAGASVCRLSTVVRERAERTAQGYHRFRCLACKGLLNRTQYPSDVIALVVLWRLRYKLSLRGHGCDARPGDD